MVRRTHISKGGFSIGAYVPYPMRLQVQTMFTRNVMRGFDPNFLNPKAINHGTLSDTRRVLEEES